MKDISVYPLRLPRSMKDEVVRVSKKDGTSINQFVANAVAARLAAIQTAEFFQDRKARADFWIFDGLINRPGGESPRAGDELPE